MVVRILLTNLIVILFSLPAFASVWIYEEINDLMTDADTSFAGIVIGNKYVAVRCRTDGDFSLYASVGTFLGSDSQNVVYRLDSETPVDAGSWNLSANGLAAFAPNHIKNELLSELRTRESFTIQISTFRGDRPTKVFTLIGSDSAISQLSCID